MLAFDATLLRSEVTVTPAGAVLVDVYGGSVRDRWLTVRRLSRALARRMSLGAPFAVEDQYLELLVTPIFPGDTEAVLRAVDAALEAVGLR